MPPPVGGGVVPPPELDEELELELDEELEELLLDELGPLLAFAAEKAVSAGAAYAATDPSPIRRKAARRVIAFSEFAFFVMVVSFSECRRSRHFDLDARGYKNRPNNRITLRFSELLTMAGITGTGSDY